MEKQTPTGLLTELYDNAMLVVALQGVITSELQQNEKELLDIVLDYSERAKGVTDRFDHQHDL